MQFWVYFSLAYSDFVCNKLNSFFQTESVLPITVIDGDLSLFLSWPTNFSVSPLFPLQLRREVIGQLWWAPSIKPRSNHQTSPFVFLDSPSCSEIVKMKAEINYYLWQELVGFKPLFFSHFSKITHRIYISYWNKSIKLCSKKLKHLLNVALYDHSYILLIFDVICSMQRIQGRVKNWVDQYHQ